MLLLMVGIFILEFLCIALPTVIFLVGSSFTYIIYVYVAILLNTIFAHLLKRHTAVGMAAKEEIAEFLTSLSDSASRASFSGVPLMTTQAAHHLPYALATDTERHWYVHYAGTMNPTIGDSQYQPPWSTQQGCGVEDIWQFILPLCGTLAYGSLVGHES